MRWRGQRKSKNVEDRRGERGGFGFPFPGGRGRRVRMPFPGGSGRRGGGGIGLIGMLVIVGLMLFFGIDPRQILQGGGMPGSGGGGTRIEVPNFDRPSAGGRQINIPGMENRTETRKTNAADDELKDFVSTVLGTTEEIWGEYFKESGKRYTPPTLVLFTGATQSGCGRGLAQMGPFYCPLDKKVYIDLGFYRELRDKFRAPGDFAQAYVVAHEVGHHVQTILGIAEQVQRAKQRMSKKEANRLQVRMELQADCLAGIWAHRLDKGVLEAGDIEEGLNAASAIGDDKIQKRTQGYVVPDAFTHGTSEQRVRWFRKGFGSGDFRDCNAFDAKQL